MKNFLKKNKAMIIIVSVILVIGVVLGVAIYRTANVRKPVFIVDKSNLVEYRGSDTEVKIDSSIISIGNSAFQDNAKVTKISFGAESKLNAIGHSAFEGCVSLVDIVLPKGVTIIGAEAFKDCELLETITIPEGVVEIEMHAFDGCKNLKSISLPSTLKTLGEEVFTGCNLLNTINSKSNDLVVENGILFNGDKTVLIKYLPSNTAIQFEVPETVKEVKAYAFEGAKSLKYLTLNTTVEKMGRCIFAGCDALEELSIPFVGSSEKQPTKFNYLFDSVPATLIKVNVLGGETISNVAFRNCNKIQVITLPNTLKYIEVEAFKNCSSLVDITIPSSVLKVSQAAFDGCNKYLLIQIDNLESETSRWDDGWNPDNLEVKFLK